MSISTEFLNQVESNRPQSGITIWALGGPSTIIQTPETTVYLDLFTGPSPEATLHKATKDIVDPNAIRKVDAVLCTHHDLDHCHQGSLTPIHANTDALLIGPRSCTKLFREWDFDPGRMVELAAHQAIQLKDLRIWAMPCNDYFDPDANSYVLQSGGVTLFDGGDTLYYSEYIQVGKRFDIDVALLNFARNPPGEIYYMNHAHVARTAQELGTRILIPKHYDLWEEFLDDPAPLIEMLEPAGITVEILAQGASFTI
ncbi:MAG: MBL fold metallo-hydrolase [Candidatus Promineifilaceae bacterium]